MIDQDLVVNRWRRYGKDRLYVETPDGAKIGFWDLATETGHPESPDHEQTLLATIANWKSAAGLTDSAPGRAALESDEPAPPVPVVADGVIGKAQPPAPPDADASDHEAGPLSPAPRRFTTSLCRSGPGRGRPRSARRTCPPLG